MKIKISRIEEESAKKTAQINGVINVPGVIRILILNYE
jgi:hypothetical protein